MKKKISIIIPAYNEEKNLGAIHAAIVGVWEGLRERYDYELIFVNDGSRDNTEAAVGEIIGRDGNVRYIEFSRNFGKEQATSAGLHECAGDAALMIDADLQHPVELIPEFIKKWEEGFEVVVGVREGRRNESLVKKLGAAAYYKIMNLISSTPIIAGATDFRLLDRKVIESFKCFTEHERLTRGLIDWLGYKRHLIYFSVKERFVGHPTYSKLKLLRLAVSSFVGHSLVPLELAGYLGMAITFFSGVLGAFIFIEKYILDDILNLRFSGPAILAVINLFLVGIMLSCLGLISLYIASIKTETSNRPLYVIRTKK